MPVKSKPYYWVECDNCGRRCPEPRDNDGISAWAHEDEAQACAQDSDWHHSDKHHLWHCFDCPPFCERCGESAGPLSGERDYHCQSCWDASAETERPHLLIKGDTHADS